MIPDKPQGVPARVLQEYLETLADCASAAPAQRQERLLLSYAELQFHRKGGSKCAVCGAAVRHVVPVRAEREPGIVLEYACLCNRCLQAERMLSARVVLSLGQSRVTYEGTLPAQLPDLN
jgi:hypothetical protein